MTNDKKLLKRKKLFCQTRFDVLLLLKLKMNESRRGQAAFERKEFQIAKLKLFDKKLKQTVPV